MSFLPNYHIAFTAIVPRTTLLIFTLLLVTSAATADTTPIGPGVAGVICAITYNSDADDDGRTIYVGGDLGGVWRTLDKGLTWHSWSTGLENRGVITESCG